MGFFGFFGSFCKFFCTVYQNCVCCVSCNLIKLRLVQSCLCRFVMSSLFHKLHLITLVNFIGFLLNGVLFLRLHDLPSRPRISAFYHYLNIVLAFYGLHRLMWLHAVNDNCEFACKHLLRLSYLKILPQKARLANSHPSFRSLIKTLYFTLSFHYSVFAYWRTYVCIHPRLRFIFTELVRVVSAFKETNENELQSGKGERLPWFITAALNRSHETVELKLRSICARLRGNRHLFKNHSRLLFRRCWSGSAPE